MEPTPDTDANFVWVPCMFQLGAELTRQVRPTSGAGSESSDHDDSDVAVDLIGPIRIQRSQAPRTAVEQAFQFVLSNKCDPMIFRYSGNGELATEFRDFVEQNDIDEDMAGPIQAVVESCLAKACAPKWEIAFTQTRSEVSDPIKQPGSSVRYSTHRIASIDTTSWKFQDHSNDIEYDDTTKILRCALRTSYR